MKMFRRLLEWGVLALLTLSMLTPARAKSDDLAKLTVQSTPSGAAVFLDGKQIDVKTPVRLTVNPGVHELKLSLSGYKEVTRRVEVYSGSAFANVSLQPFGGSPPKPAPVIEKKAPAPVPEQAEESKAPAPEKKDPPKRDAAPEPEAPIKIETSGGSSEDTDSSDPEFRLSGDIKVAYRGKDELSPSAPANHNLNLLPDNNPFSDWLKKNREDSEPAKNEPAPAEKEKDDFDPDEVFALVDLSSETKNNQSPEDLLPDNLVPISEVPDKSVAKDEVDDLEVNEFLAGCEVGDSLGAEEVASLAGCLPEPKVEWPESAEDLMEKAASNLPKFPSRFNILLLGLDRRDRRGILATGAEIPLDKLRKKPANSDVIMVVQLDFIDRQVRMVSIPRDTKVNIPGRRRRGKANSAYAYGRENLAKKMVEEFLDIEIHRTVVADWYSAKKCISLFKNLGLDYNGFSEAEMFWHLRKRSFNRGDFRRIERQQMFLRYAAGEYLRLFNEYRDAEGTTAAAKKGLLSMAVKQGLEFVETDMSKEEVDLLCYAWRNYDTREITMAQVRGRGGLEGGGGEEGGGTYFFVPYPHQSFNEIIAKAEDSEEESDK